MKKSTLFLVVTLVTVVLASSLSAAAAPLTKVKVGYLHTVAVDTHMWLAKEKGYFAKYGIEVEPVVFNAGVSLMQALSGGSVDVAILGAVISNFPSRGVGKIFLLNDIEYATAMIFVQGDSGIKSVADLKGRRITTTKGTTADVLLYTALTEAGVKYSDVNVINMDMAGAVSAFIAKATDAVATWSPFDVQIEKANPTARKLTQAGDYYPKSAIIGGWVASNKMYEKNRPVLVNLAKAWLDANEALLKDTENSLKIVHKTAYSNLPYSEVAEAFAKEKVATNDEWAAQFKDGRAAKWIGQVEQVFIQLGAFPDFVPPEKFFDTSIYLEAYAARK